MNLLKFKLTVLWVCFDFHCCIDENNGRYLLQNIQTVLSGPGDDAALARLVASQDEVGRRQHLGLSQPGLGFSVAGESETTELVRPLLQPTLVHLDPTFLEITSDTNMQIAGPVSFLQTFSDLLYFQMQKVMMVFKSGI